MADKDKNNNNKTEDLDPASPAFDFTGYFLGLRRDIQQS